MRHIIVFFLLLFLFACSFEDKHIIKEIKNDDLTVQWYYYDQFRERSADCIDVTSNNQTIQIYKASDVVTDIQLKNNKIILKLYEPHRGIVYTKKVKSTIGDYEIILDSTATYDEYLNKKDAK